MSDVIANLPHAVLEVISPNEIELRQKSKREAQDDSYPNPLAPDVASLEDPIGSGVGAWARPLGRLKYYLAKLRYDVLRWKDSKIHRTEVGFKKIAIDELFDGDGKPMPLIAEYLTPNDEDSSDQAEQPVYIITRSGMRILVPLHVEAGITGAVLPEQMQPQKVSRFYSDGGRFCFNVQDDEAFPKFVIYDTHQSADESTWTAVKQLRITEPV